MNNRQSDYKTLASTWYAWFGMLGTFATVFLSAWQASALEHLAYPAFYPSIPSSADGDTTYTYVWNGEADGRVSGWAEDQMVANTTDEVKVNNGTDTLRGYYEYYDDVFYVGCPYGMEIITDSIFTHRAQWGWEQPDVYTNYFPSDATDYCFSIPPTPGLECSQYGLGWSPFQLGQNSLCGNTTTTHFQGTDSFGNVIWTVDYTYETNVCYNYEFGGFSCNGQPPWGLTFNAYGISPYFEVVVWMKQGTTPPSLASLGIGTPEPGYVVLSGGSGGGGGITFPPLPPPVTPPPPTNFPPPLPPPHPIPAPNGPLGQRIAAGGCHSLAVKADGSVWAWGDDWYDQLGRQGSGSITNPVPVNGLSNVIAVAAGLEHSLALDMNGCVWGWGDDTVGQLGISYPMTGYYTPQQLKTSGYSPMTNMICIAASCDGNTSYAVSSNGYVVASGDNTYGQLGLGYSGGNVPVFIGVHNLSGIVSIAAGQYHVLALTTNGLVCSWGWDEDGQLGDGTSGPNDWKSTPMLVTNLTNTVIVAIAAGGSSSYALDNSGNVWQWGNGITTPVLVNGLDPTNGIIGITAGYFDCYALVADGSYWAWTQGAKGALGNGTTTSTSVPVHVSFSDGTQSLGVAASTLFSLSIQSDGTLRSWGDNQAFLPYTHSTGSGQLGRDTGATGYSTTPGPVNPF